MPASKVSFHSGKKLNRSHNTREFNRDKWNKDGHIDFSRTPDNETLVDELGRWDEFCEEVFGKAIDEFNEKNATKHPDRVIDKSKEYASYKKKVQETIIQVGNEDFNPLSNTEHKEWLKEVLKHWQTENPSLVVVGAYIHMDEMTPHIHIDWLPVSHSTRGQSVKISMDGALKEIGYARKKDQKYDESPYRMFLSDEREKLENIGRKYCEIEEADHTGMKHHQETYQYRAKMEKEKSAQARTERFAEELKTMEVKNKKAELTAEVEELSEEKESLTEDLATKNQELKIARNNELKAKKELKEAQIELDQVKTDADLNEITKAIQTEFKKIGNIDLPVLASTEEKTTITGKVKPATVTVPTESLNNLIQYAQLLEKERTALETMDAGRKALENKAAEKNRNLKDSFEMVKEEKVAELTEENTSLKAENEELKVYKKMASNVPKLTEKVAEQKKQITNQQNEINALTVLVEALKELIRAAFEFLLSRISRDGQTTALDLFEQSAELDGRAEGLLRDFAAEVRNGRGQSQGRGR